MLKAHENKLVYLNERVKECIFFPSLERKTTSFVLLLADLKICKLKSLFQT